MPHYMIVRVADNILGVPHVVVGAGPQDIRGTCVTFLVSHNNLATLQGASQAGRIRSNGIRPQNILSSLQGEGGGSHSKKNYILTVDSFSLAMCAFCIYTDGFFCG